MLENESILRLGCFLSILSLMLFWEQLSAKRIHPLGRWKHRAWNLLLVVVDTVCLRAVAPWLVAGMAVGAALWASERGFGLLHWAPLPHAVAAVVGFLLLDFAIYLQHWASHQIPMLWRFHQVHHSDLEVDTTTALRFHPIEILLSMGYKILVVAILGIPAVGVLVLEIVLNGAALFNHGNVRIPEKLDRLLRWVIVTPDMHRIHHSVVCSEMDSNYGFNFSWWDRIFKTYTANPANPQEQMQIGLNAYREGESLHLGRLLLLPFQGFKGEEK